MVLSMIQVWGKLKVLHSEYKENFRKVMAQVVKIKRIKGEKGRKTIFVFKNKITWGKIDFGSSLDYIYTRVNYVELMS